MHTRTFMKNSNSRLSNHHYTFSIMRRRQNWNCSWQNKTLRFSWCLQEITDAMLQNAQFRLLRTIPLQASVPHTVNFPCICGTDCFHKLPSPSTFSKQVNGIINSLRTSSSMATLTSIAHPWHHQEQRLLCTKHQEWDRCEHLMVSMVGTMAHCWNTTGVTSTSHPRKVNAIATR